MASAQPARMVKAVERATRRVGRQVLQGAAWEGCMKMWRDFSDQTDISRTRKPEAWAAALAYTYERMRLGLTSQEEVARAFKVSAITVSQKYRQIAETLKLLLLDPRYIPAAMRSRIRREEGPVPEDLPLREAPPWGGWGWRPPIDSFEEWLAELETGPLHRAQDWVYQGWDSCDDLEEAERCFREALRLDPTLADAHNGLAEVALAGDHLAAAEAHFQRAYRLAREALGSESPQAYHWWGELETRPYMRAREGLARVYWSKERYREAIAEYEALLHLNPNDNQGVRYLIGPLYQLAGDPEGALCAYQQYEQDYPDDTGDPQQTFCWGLALHEAERYAEAISRWRQAIFQNIYIAPLLLAEQPPQEDIWLFTDLAWPAYAEDYLANYGELWERARALERLRRLWHDKELQAELKRWLALGERLQELSDAVRQSDDENSPRRQEWKRLSAEQRKIEERAASKELLRRVGR